MSHMPQAAITTIAAALDDYRDQIPAEQQTPDGAAAHVAAYLLASGWGLHITDATNAA
ncbi:hypothetical protein [Streptomyces hebeiensis]